MAASGRVLLVTAPSWAPGSVCLICVLCESLAWSRKGALEGPTLLLHFSTSSRCLGLKGTGAISLKRQRISTDVLAPLSGQAS